MKLNSTLRIICVGFCLLCAGCQDLTPDGQFGQSSSSVVCRKPILDLGNLLPNSIPKTVEFELENSGNLDATIKNVRVSCKCVDARIPQTKLKAGQSVVVEIDVDQSEFGEFEASVLVNFELGDSEYFESIALSVAWQVSNGVEFEKKLVLLKGIPIRKATAAQVEFEITSPEIESRIDELSVESNSENLECMIDAKNRRINLIVRPNTPLNEYQRAAIQISDLNTILATLPVLWITEKVFEVHPSSLIHFSKYGNLVRFRVSATTDENGFIPTLMAATSDLATELKVTPLQSTDAVQKYEISFELSNDLNSRIGGLVILEFAGERAMSGSYLTEQVSIPVSIVSK